MESCQKMELTIKRVHWTHFTKDIFPWWESSSWEQPNSLEKGHAAATVHCGNQMCQVWGMSVHLGPPSPPKEEKVQHLDVYIRILSYFMFASLGTVPDSFPKSKCLRLFPPIFFRAWFSFQKQIFLSLQLPINLPLYCVVLVPRCWSVDHFICSKWEN